MIHSGLVNQRRGGGFQEGYPSQRNNHPRDQTMRPWVSGFDLPIMEKSAYATPEAPAGTSKMGVQVNVPKEVRYHDIFGKTASADVKYYLSQLLKRVSRGGGGMGSGGFNTGQMGGPQRPTGQTRLTPGQNPQPGLPPEAPGEQGGVPVKAEIVTESITKPDISEQNNYEVVNLENEMKAEDMFEEIFYKPEDTFADEAADIAWAHGKTILDAQSTRFDDQEIQFPDVPTELPNDLPDEEISAMEAKLFELAAPKVPTHAVVEHLSAKEVTSAGPTVGSSHKHRERSFHKDVRFQPYEKGVKRPKTVETIMRKSKSIQAGISEVQVVKAEQVNGVMPVGIKRKREDLAFEIPNKARNTNDRPTYSRVAPGVKRKHEDLGFEISNKARNTNDRPTYSKVAPGVKRKHEDLGFEISNKKRNTRDRETHSRGVKRKREDHDFESSNKARNTNDRAVYTKLKNRNRKGLSINTDVPKVAGPRVRKSKITQPMGIPTRRQPKRH